MILTECKFFKIFTLGFEKCVKCNMVRSGKELEKWRKMVRGSINAFSVNESIRNYFLLVEKVF